MAEFCLIKYTVSTYQIDGSDLDRDPDKLPVNGRIVFEPLMDKGDSVVVTENGVSETISLTPIEARVTNSELYHRGEPGIKLFAGGATSNPERIRYRANFHNMVSGTKSITMKPVIFEAVPGGELILSLAQPVPRQPYPGIGADQAVVNSANEAADRAWEAVATIASSKGEAVAAAQNAATSEQNAAASEKNAKASETNADDSASSASSSAAAASTAAGAAAVSEESANSSATSASEAATAAEGAAVSAATSEQNASISEQNAAASEERAGQSAETASNVSTEVQGVVNDAASAILIDVEGSLDPVYVRQDDRTVHVKQFGAVGDGITDDTVALQDAIRSGRPLYWGGPSDVYRTTGQIIRSATSPVVWRSDGATIFCDPAAPIHRVVYFDLSGYSVSMVGPLTIDANRSAFLGLGIDNTSTTLVDAYLSNITIKNVYRSSQDFNSGDGLSMRGGFRTLNLVQPTVQNVTMAPGAGTTSQGVSGITIAAYDDIRTPHEVFITSLMVDGIYDEDALNIDSQNGLRLYGSTGASSGLAPSEMKFHIVGGTVRNCGGRSIKSQCEWGTITGLKIYRDQPRARGKAEIDFQRGGGQVTDVSIQYDNAASSEIVKTSGANLEGKTAPHGSISGLKVLISGDEVPQTIVNFLQEQDLLSYVTLRDVEVVGSQPEYVLTLTGVSGTTTHASISDVFAAPTAALVRGHGGTPNGWGGSVNIANCVNIGPVLKPAFLSTSGISARPDVSSANLARFTGASSDGRAVLATVPETFSGWNNLQLVSGYGSVYAPSYYRPPAGTYRITYLRPSGEAFDRHTQITDRGTITPANGVFEEAITFGATDYFRIVGSMTDLKVVFERLL